MRRKFITNHLLAGRVCSTNALQNYYTQTFDENGIANNSRARIIKIIVLL